MIREPNEKQRRGLRWLRDIVQGIEADAPLDADARAAVKYLDGLLDTRPRVILRWRRASAYAPWYAVTPEGAEVRILPVVTGFSGQAKRVITVQFRAPENPEWRTVGRARTITEAKRETAVMLAAGLVEQAIEDQNFGRGR